MNSAKQPPGPGFIEALRMTPDLTRDALGTMSRISRTYGDLVRVKIGPMLVYLLNHPDYARHVLQDNHTNYRKSSIYHEFSVLLGDGQLVNAPIKLPRDFPTPARQRVGRHVGVLNDIVRLLSLNPDKEERLAAEIAQVVGDRPPTFADLPRLRYCQRVLEETMRLYPPAWVVERTPLKDDEIGGFRIEAGARVTMFMYEIHRHRDFWEDPERFEPERFSEERSAGRHRFSLFPFSGGPRICLGKDLSMVEMTLVSHHGHPALPPPAGALASGGAAPVGEPPAARRNRVPPLPSQRPFGGRDGVTARARAPRGASFLACS